MNRKAILSILLLSSIAGSTVNMSAGIFGDIWDDNPSMMQKIWKISAKTLRKNFTKALPVMVIGMLTKEAAIWIADTTTSCVKKTKDLVLNKSQNGVHLTAEQVAKINKEIQALVEQNMELKEALANTRAKAEKNSEEVSSESGK